MFYSGGAVHGSDSGSRPRPTIHLTEGVVARWALISLSVGFLVLFLVLPLAIVLVEALRQGVTGWFEAILAVGYAGGRDAYAARRCRGSCH